jgi:hypothetical protein
MAYGLRDKGNIRRLMRPPFILFLPKMKDLRTNEAGQFFLHLIELANI